MAEIKRKPILMEVEGGFIEGFDEGHTLADIARWLLKNRVDAEELHYLLGEMLKGEQHAA